jgi:plastocyanin
MNRFRMRTTLAATTTALVAAAAMAAFALPNASAAPAEEDPVGALLGTLTGQSAKPPVPDGNSPGTGGDAYKPDDPFVDNGEAPKDIPLGTVVAKQFAFFPTKMTVTPGQEITLDNRDVAIHNIQTDGKKPIMKSKDAENGQKVTVKAPAKAGKYEAFCFYHQSMLVDITVK